MASLLPLISEILPMIMPASAQVLRADHLRPAATSVVDGPVVTRCAIIDKCDKMCASGRLSPGDPCFPLRWWFSW